MINFTEIILSIGNSVSPSELVFRWRVAFYYCIIYRDFYMAKNLNINIAERTYITIDISLNLPEKNFKKVYPSIPNTMPSAMLYAIGIIMIERNAGIASV